MSQSNTMANVCIHRLPSLFWTPAGTGSTTVLTFLSTKTCTKSLLCHDNICCITMEVQTTEQTFQITGGKRTRAHKSYKAKYCDLFGFETSNQSPGSFNSGIYSFKIATDVLTHEVGRGLY